jgi:hypothetical protein
MSDLIKLLTINKEFVFLGKIDDLKTTLTSSKDIDYELLSEREIKFRPTISWGTMTGQIRLVEGIHVRAYVAVLDSDRLKIFLQTKVRPEHYFLVVMFIIFLIAISFSDESKWALLYVSGLWIICHVWFQFIYRLQENRLVGKIVKKLSLTKM